MDDKTIIADKCDRGWFDTECPRPATCMRYHYGQYGHRVIYLFCKECWANPEPVCTLRNLGWMQENASNLDSLPPHSLDSEEFFEQLDSETAALFNQEWSRLNGKEA